MLPVSVQTVSKINKHKSTRVTPMSPFIAPEPKAPPAKHTVTPQSTHFTSMFNKSTMPQGSQRQRQGPLSMLELSSFPHYLKKQAQAEPLQWVWIWGSNVQCVWVLIETRTWGTGTVHKPWQDGTQRPLDRRWAKKGNWETATNTIGSRCQNHTQINLPPLLVSIQSARKPTYPRGYGFYHGCPPRGLV